MVVQNSRGSLLEIHSFKVPIQDPVIAELWSIRQAICICIKNEWKQVCCDTEAKNVARMLTKGHATSCHWSAFSFLKEILRLGEHFVSINFSWCYRDCNSVAHEIAKWAVFNGFYGLINEECLPLSIFEILAMEKVVTPTIHARALNEV